MHIGPITVDTVDQWTPDCGLVVCWRPSAGTLEKVRQAPASSVPASYMQAQHIRGFCEQKARGLDYSRLMIASCVLPGRCDVRAMTYIVNAYLRRHDTYRSWFEYGETGHITRRTITNPADIEVVATDHGELRASQIRELVLSTPDPLSWDCFLFAIIQSAGYFTLVVSVDHLHMDGMLAGALVTEFYMMYNALISGSPPIPLPEAGSYDAYCTRQHRDAMSLSLEDPQMRAWIEFAERNGGSLPDFPLPLGDPSVPCGGAIRGIQLMDEQQMASFEAACVAANARFVGGLFACAALAEYELTGAPVYYGVTPIDTRSTDAELWTMGWFTGLIPVTVPVTPTSFAETANAAQASFDSARELAAVPYDRVVELAPWLSRPRPNFSVLNYMDAGVPPLSGAFSTHFEGLNLGIWVDGRYSYQFSLMVHRMRDETTMTAMHPANPIAVESVDRYLATVKSVFDRVAEGRKLLSTPSTARA